MESLLRALAALLSGIFFIGLAGSALVILLITVEDVRVLLEKDETPSPSEGIQQH